MRTKLIPLFFALFTLSTVVSAAPPPADIRAEIYGVIDEIVDRYDSGEDFGERARICNLDETICFFCAQSTTGNVVTCSFKIVSAACAVTCNADKGCGFSCQF